MDKKIIKYILSGTFCMGLLSITSCTNNFDEINRPGHLITDEEYGRDNFKLQSYFSQMIDNVISSQENSFQMNSNFIGDTYGRYLIPCNDAWNTNSYAIYAPQDSWRNAYPFNDVMQKFTTPWFAVKSDTEETGAAWDWAQILRVAAMHRLVDMYGALPYSKVNSEDLAVPYDDAKTMYHAMLGDLTYAIEDLTALIGAGTTSLMPDADVVYKGDLTKWVKFANSLKLRLAMRLSLVEEEKEYARQMAEEAVSHSIGVITSNADSPAFPYPGNAAVWKICINWGDARPSADIVSYMVGYKDPRLSLYFHPTTFEGHEDAYAGFRAGSSPASRDIADKYSAPVATENDNYYWMTAAEVAFLKAEGALYKWNMGGDAKSLYEEGVTLSFDQWHASGVAAYLEDNSSVQADYTAFDNAAYSAKHVSDITVKWDDGASEDKKLERIITQKWLAMYPLGQEAWSEYRRTGYPKFFTLPNQPANYPSLTTVAHRIPFTPTEYSNNPNNINSGTVQQLLGGPDQYDTKIFWAK